MHRPCWWVFAVFSLGGCALTTEDRFKDYNEDGVHLYQHGNYRDATDSFRAALAIRPNDAALLYNLGECYDRQGDQKHAEEFYQRCLALAPNHQPCSHAYLDLLVRTGRQQDAERYVANWLTREPRLSSPYAESGWLCRLAGDQPQAQARLQQALALDPHDVRALTEMALLYEELHLPDRALVLYQRVLDREPQQTEISNHVNYLLTKGAKPPHPE
jgi:Tfp pilus assembly protein PilF